MRAALEVLGWLAFMLLLGGAADLYDIVIRIGVH